uniref:Uncharacterized protein n=1 Tax=Pyramimonas obovata TaxID=1411642 RepID=A0A7S0MZE8_9CHLO
MQARSSATTCSSRLPPGAMTGLAELDGASSPRISVSSAVSAAEPTGDVGCGNTRSINARARSAARERSLRSEATVRLRLVLPVAAGISGVRGLTACLEPSDLPV